MRKFKRQYADPHKAAHPLVKRLWEEINKQRASQEDVADRSGVSSSTMRKWRNGQRSPYLNHIEAVFNALGYEIYIREIRD